MEEKPFIETQEQFEKCLQEGGGFFYKHNLNDKIWWDDTRFGNSYFTFDKKKIFCYQKDYPENLTKEEKEQFDIENPDKVL